MNVLYGREKNKNGAIEIREVSCVTGRARKWVLFKTTATYCKETISPGRGLTKKSDTLSRPSAIYTGPALYCTARP